VRSPPAQDICLNFVAIPATFLGLGEETVLDEIVKDAVRVPLCIESR